MPRFALALFALPLFATGALASTEISLATFKSVELEGGGRVVLKHGPEQHVILVTGSTQFTHFHIRNGNQLVIEACNDRCPSHYDMTVEITSPRIEGVAVKGGGDIVTDGAFPTQAMLAAAIQGGGDIDVRAVPADDVNAAVNGGGHIRIAPRQTLHAAVNGGGRIVYSGHPSVTQAVKGGGSVAGE